MFFPKPIAFLLSAVLVFIWLDTNKFNAARLPQVEVDALNQIARTMGSNDRNFAAGICNVSEKVNRDMGPEKNITCTCQNGTCHVTHLIFKFQSLPGVLPSELVNLPYLKVIDFAYNYLSGSIPPEWASMQLEFISVFGNRLSGNIPTYLGNISSLTYLDLEANQFSGAVPPEIGKLVNLRTLKLSSNRLTGNLPVQLAELKNLTDFRINDNNFNGSLPAFISNWKKLQRLEMQASGLEGPIPSSISALVNLITLIVSDINGTTQPFPDLRNMTAINRIILKKCNIVGQIPQDIWQMSKLRVLDLSFNGLSGELVKVTRPPDLRFLYLTGNNLSGNIPESILQTGLAVDLCEDSSISFLHSGIFPTITSHGKALSILHVPGNWIT